MQLIFHRILSILKSKLKVHIYQSKRFGGLNTWKFINFFQEASHISFKVTPPPPPRKLKWLFKLRVEEPETCGFCRSRIKLPKYLRFRLCICLDKSFWFFHHYTGTYKVYLEFINECVVYILQTICEGYFTMVHTMSHINRMLKLHTFNFRH